MSFPDLMDRLKEFIKLNREQLYYVSLPLKMRIQIIDYFNSNLDKNKIGDYETFYLVRIVWNNSDNIIAFKVKVD